MDWNAATEKNREALKRVLAMLVAMIGQSAIGSWQSGPAPVADERTDCLLPTADRRLLLPRRLHRAVLRLLRPAEAATRRLIIIAARGVVVPVRSGGPSHTATFVPPPSRALPETPPPASRVADERRASLPGLSSPPSGGEVARAARRRGGVHVRLPSRAAGAERATSPRLSFSLFDPLRRFHDRRPTQHGVPRISLPGFSDPFPLPLPPSDDNAIDATRLALRLAVLARVLDDLPREARRFARWQAVGAGAQTKESGAATAGPQAVSPLRVSEGRVGQAAGPGRSHCRRLWPLRHGRPPGLPRRPSHAVHDILEVTHGLAFWVLERPDTS
jgi:hypothetical protein